MFGRRADKQSENSQIVQVSDCLVRPGIIMRSWLSELARSFVELRQPREGESVTWADGLQDVQEIDRLLDGVLRGPGSFATLTNAFVGDVDESSGDDAHAGAEDVPEPEPLQPPRNRDELELYCEEMGMRVIGWLVAALDAPEGTLVPHERNEEVLARYALRSLSSFTVSYAFGTFEKNIVIDALCGADVRERLDRLALRIIELPGLQWWSEEFDPANYGFHSVGSGRGARIAAPGESFPADSQRRTGWGRLSKQDRETAAQFKALDRDFGDIPRVAGYSWDPGSQLSVPRPQSFRATDPSWVTPTREELRSALGRYAASVGEELEAIVDERLLEERAQTHSSVCTEQFLGDDAGDRPLRALVQQSLPPREYRIATVHAARDWTDLVERYPMALVPYGTSDTPRVWSGDAHGTWLTVDWSRAATQFDGIYLSVLGSLDVAYVPLRVVVPGPAGEREGWTMMTGWTPGSVLWLNDPVGSWPEAPKWSFDDADREYEEAAEQLRKARDRGDN
ncbi:hypothetical protein VR010_03125 [Actinomycetaceae bacterium L2_0104]